MLDSTRRRNSNPVSLIMKSKLTNGRYRAQKRSARAMCKPHKRGWEDKKTIRDIWTATQHEQKIKDALSRVPIDEWARPRVSGEHRPLAVVAGTLPEQHCERPIRANSKNISASCRDGTGWQPVLPRYEAKQPGHFWPGCCNCLLCRLSNPCHPCHPCRHRASEEFSPSPEARSQSLR